jgi:ankyrin repeat protein
LLLSDKNPSTCHRGVLKLLTFFEFLFQDSVTQEETDDEAMNTVITEVTEFSDPDHTPDLGSKENLQGILGGSELEACDSRGETPIFWAARQGNTEAVRLLAAAGAKIASQNKVSEITHTWIFFYICERPRCAFPVQHT